MLKISLRSKVLMFVGLIAVMLLAVSTYLLVSMPADAEHLAVQGYQTAARNTAQQLAHTLAPTMRGYDGGEIADAWATIRHIDTLQYAVLLRPDGKVLSRYKQSQVPLTALEQSTHAGMDVSEGVLRVVQDIEVDEQIVGSLIIGFNITAFEQAAHNIRVSALLMALTFLPAIFSLCAYVAIAILRPIGELASMTDKVVRTGDLTRTVELLRSDELGVLANSVSAIINQQRVILGRINGLIVGITEVAERVFIAGHDVSLGATTIQLRVGDTADAMRDMQETIREISLEVETLAGNSERSSASLVQMASSNASVNATIETMAKSTSVTTEAIDNMARSLGEIAHNIERLNDTILQTSTAVSNMTSNINDVERTSKETAELSEQVSADAEIGVLALQKTLQGIDNIKQASQSAAGVIVHLGRRIEEIGAILRVIDEVAAQTKLLSLNAAIIASQAGEHGRGFSIVADQIKQLAQRTGSSTREISSLIQSVQEESRNAISAMEVGVTSVDTGVVLGHEAAGALEKIRQSAVASTTMIKKIASAAVDQARGSREIADSIERIAQSVGQISSYSQQQVKGTEQITINSKDAHLLTEQVRNATAQQARGSDQIVHAMHAINGMLNRLSIAQRTQAQGATRVQHSVEDIRSISLTQSTAVAELESAINSLSEEAKALAGEVGKYKL
ncbi:hypothetical protein Q3G72_025077 [Acer saccharum]|nr:hypothetical protein Q3G72_025077 [Acer saccharum]